eukprot:GHVQ01000894.1.p1 GENE.GHVQ01000894.1~~GHVQ01000894.1.p1  ORF type:complete len:251 (+),score=23.21 GHVQ01000894.1:463-1215(+)
MKKLSARYLRLCSRSKRQVAIVNVKVIDAMLSTLPSAVDDELRIQGHAESIESIIKHAPIIEAEFNRRRKYSPSWSAAICPNVPAATSGTRNWIPTSPCHGWGDQGHWRKDCPYREYRCDKCHVIGHIAKACRNFIVKDSLGRVRQRVIPKERKLQTETAVDGSTAQKVKTAQDVLNQIERLAKARNDKARNTRQSNRLVPVRERKNHPVGAAVMGESDEADSVVDKILSVLGVNLDTEEEVIDDALQND